MACPRKFTPEQERFIGRFCVRARRRGVSWKRLMRRFGVGRDYLWRRWREALAREKCVFKHIADGQPPERSEYGRRIGAGD